MNKSLLVAIISVLVTAATTYYLTRQGVENASGGDAMEEKKPLYWVAPMDPNYRRDKPGQSPMGMDLIPVYDDAVAGQDDAGLVSISPTVVNNLGVRTTPVKRGALNTTITTVGYVQYDEDRLIHIHPRVEGWIDKLYVKASGDPVKRGDPLYSLYSPELVNAQEELLLALNRKNARLIKAAEDRLKALQVDAAVIAQLKRDRAVKQKLTFYVPQTGVVDNLHIREGFFVKPGTTLMSVGALDSVWVEAEVFERQAVLVEVGSPVSMTLDYLPGQQWQGQVDYVYPTLDPKTRTARVRLRFANPEELLKPNMFAQVAIQACPKTDVLVVPREAVIRTGTQNRVVLAVGEGRFKSVVVTLGYVAGDMVEVTSGLEEGELIVTSAQFLLDSESSKTADFARLESGDAEKHDMAEMDHAHHGGHHD
ncbi:efflux RND transporter periplasmic adaptor subunit [bacterium SCSIO 12696]|nr:efflux RND transporter periplasmic adaptor subunit [bacterium SCSIO 12696]